MFPRVLLDSKIWHMTIDWFGLGKLEVSHYPTSRSAIAPNWLKTHFINTIDALSAKGTEIGPNNSIVIEVVETYAEFILTPNSLRARAAFLQNPQQLADAILLANSSVKIESSTFTRALQNFINKSQTCAQELFSNAEYIESELPKVEITDNLRQMTLRICSALKATRGEIFIELQSWKSVSLSHQEYTNRAENIVSLLSKDLNQLHVLATSIRAQSDINQKFRLASMLIGESATNIYQAFALVCDTVKEVSNTSTNK